MAERFYREMELVRPDRDTWTIGWNLRERARTHGNRPYLEVPHQGVSHTFAETLALAEALARGFVENDCVLGDRVLLMATNCAEVVLCWYGAALAGVVEVPINTAYRGAFLEHQVRTTTPRVAVIDAEFATRFTEGDRSAYESIERYFVLGEGAAQEAAVEALRGAGLKAAPYEELPRPDSVAELPEVAPGDTGAIFFTSGTTGLSKGVSMSHSQLCFIAQQTIGIFQLTEDDTQMAVGPLFHGNAQFMGALPDLIVGCRFVLREKYSATRWIDQIRECRATVTNFIGVMMDWTFKQPPRPDDADNDLRCVLAVPVPTSIVEGFRSRFGVEVLTTEYGMTEISIPIIAPYGVDRPTGAAGLLADEFFEARIVDPETDREMPVGEVGEFVVRGKEPWVILTDYFNMPDRTAEAQRNLWFHTGDGLRRDEDGWYYFVDRIKDAIRRRGENISSYEVEQAVVPHESILECAAVAVPAHHTEAGEDEVALFVVPNAGAELEVEEVREWCVRQLPRFAVPEHILVIAELPMTPSGKVRKVELREMAQQAADEPAREGVA
ncbi:MAG TPA: AMP-binding protein [Solirubrobacterales bacterium]